MEAASQTFSATDFRNTMRTFATGVIVITTRGKENDYGVTASAFSSVSLDPPLVLICLDSSGQGCGAINRNEHFAINILAVDQQRISRYFAAQDRPRQGRRLFAEIPHRTEATGAPILEGVAGFLDCKLHASYVAGDHEIFIGEVLALGADNDVEPLVFHNSEYRFLTDQAAEAVGIKR